MYRTFLFIYLCLFAPFSRAQLPRTDSLERAADTYPKDDSVKVDLYNLIALEAVTIDPNKGRMYATRAYDLAKEIGYLNGYARGLNLVGSSFLVVGEYETSLEFYLRSLEVYEQTHFQEGIFITYNNLGELFEKKFQFEKALEYHKKSLSLKNKYLKGRFPIMSHINLGKNYYNLGRLDSAFYYFETAERMAEEENRLKAIAYAQTGIGKVYGRQNNLSLAYNYLNQANIIYDSLKDFVGMSQVALEKAKISQARNLFDDSKKQIQNAIENAEKTNSKELKLVALALQYTIDSTLQDFESAFISMRKLHKLATEIFDLAKERQLQTIQARFEFEEKEKIHQELIQEKELTQEVVRYQRAFIAVIGLILVFISIVSFLFFKQVQKQRKLNKLLTDKNKEIKETALELEILNNNLEQMVEERSNVIKKKNVKLKEYSFLNAHIVRGPLANILGLTKLLKSEIKENEKMEMIDHLYYSADKLDDVLTDIKKRLEKGELIN